MAKLHFRLTPEESLDFPLDQPVTRLGRNPANEIVINNTWISSFHAEFRRAGEALTLRDLKSSNGTAVNGVPIAEQVLSDGDRISFGQLDAVYHAETVPAAAVSAPVSPAASAPAKPPAAAPVVIRPMAAPPATIAYDNVRKEGELELEELRKKLTKANAATVQAIKEQEAAEAGLEAAKAARMLEEAGLQEARRATETAREAVAALASAREKAAVTLAELEKETSVLASSRDAIRNSLSVEEVAARTALEQANQQLAERRQEITGLETAIHTLRGESGAAQHAAEQAQADLAAAQNALRQGTADLEATRTLHHELLAKTGEARAVLEQLKSETDGLRDQAGELRREAGQSLERTAAAAAELTTLQGAIAQAREAAAAEEEKLAERVRSIRDLELREQTLAAKISGWEQQEAQAVQAAAQVAEHQAAAARYRQEAGASQAAKLAAEAGLAAAEGHRTALAEETAAVQARLEHLRRETDGAEALNSKVTDLRQQQAEAERRLDFLNDRLAGMSEAPDPNWGTVHSLARSFIKKLDLIDDLIAHLTGQPEATGTLDQLQVFRAGLLDILKEYSIEAYSLEPGTVIDVAARKRIQIVETLSEGGHDGTRIVRTYRPGYVCLNGDLGISTLLRKADVAVSIPLG